MALVILFEQGTLTFQQKCMNSIGFANRDLAKLSCLIVVDLIQAYLQRALDLPNVWDNRTLLQTIADKEEQNVLLCLHAENISYRDEHRHSFIRSPYIEDLFLHFFFFLFFLNEL